MPGYLSQIVSTATAGSRADGPRLRPSVRSRSPIADYDQRLGMAEWDAATVTHSANEPGQDPRIDGTTTGETLDPGTLARPQPRLTPAPWRSSAIELAPTPPAVGHPEILSAVPAEADTSRDPRGYRPPSTESAEPDAADTDSPQPKRPLPVSTHEQERRAKAQNLSSNRPDPAAPSQPSTKAPSDAQGAEDLRAMGQGTPHTLVPPAASERALANAPIAGTAQPAAFAGRSHRAASTEATPGDHVPPPPTVPRERAAHSAVARQRRVHGRPDHVAEMRGAGGPRVIIDRLEIEVVPPAPLVSARKPGAGEGVGSNRAGSKIGPLNDPLAAVRALSLRYR